MKPYIGKNDGVPDNNRYSEALEAAKETVEALNKLTDQALAQYTALVDSAVAGHITDERELEHIMDGLLDFGDDLRFLEIYKRLVPAQLLQASANGWRTHLLMENAVRHQR